MLAKSYKACFLCFFLALLTHEFGFAQQVPDLPNDTYLPYLNESDKRQKILDSYVNYLRANNVQVNYSTNSNAAVGLPSIVPAIQDPLQEFTKYHSVSQQRSSTSTSMQSSFAGGRNNGNGIQQYENDRAQYERQKQISQQYVLDAYKELYKPEIQYGLGLHTGAPTAPFVSAEKILTDMLSGAEKIDFLRAVYAVESAVDKTLTWPEFSSMFQSGIAIINALMKQNKVSPADNLGKVMAIYRYMADTTSVFIAAKEKNIVSKPMLYDFDDYQAKKDITKVFVSKLLRTGSGQCMSLPTLFYLYAKSIGADVHLAFAPEHSFIKFKDNLGTWQDVELTGRMFTTDDFYWQSGFIKAEQVKSHIYLNPLSEKEVLVELLTTLAKSYVRTFGTDERLFEMATIAKKYAPNDLSTNMLMFGYKRDLYQNIVRQYNVYKFSQREFDNDQQRKKAETDMYAALDHLKKDLGYSKMPDWAYQQWLDGVNKLANKQKHLVRRRQLEQQLRQR